MIDTAPHSDQLEISVFGPGIGECVVAHIGHGDWIVVDSCIDKESRRPVALEYLASLQIDAASQVKLVVATHWHDDHIQGIAEVLKAAESARFAQSAAYGFKDLIPLVSLGARTAPLSSGIREYSGIIDVLQERRESRARRETVGPIYALANRKLLSLTGLERSVKAEVFALSPSDAVLNLAKAELTAALSTIKQGRRPPSPGPNQLSVVLWLKVGVLDALLGADLEDVAGPTEGWNAIISSAERPAGRAGFFKIPHHGSENADSSGCWTDLLLEQPFGILTPYSPSRLPRPQDIARLCARTHRLFLTSDVPQYPLPRRDHTIERTLREVVVTRRALTGRMGHVRLRADASGASSDGPLITTKNGARQQCGHA